MILDPDHPICCTYPLPPVAARAMSSLAVLLRAKPADPCIALQRINTYFMSALLGLQSDVDEKKHPVPDGPKNQVVYQLMSSHLITCLAVPLNCKHDLTRFTENMVCVPSK